MIQSQELNLQYITNEAGEKTAVILPIADFEELLEDLQDLAIVGERRDEPTISHQELITELEKDGLYHINIFYSEEDGGYIADIPDLQYCSAFGSTEEEALREVLQAKAIWLETAQAQSKPIPEPKYRPTIYQLAS